MEKIYIILMHTKTLPSKLVKAFTRYNYSHVAISLDPTCYETFSFGRKKVNNILDGGFSVQYKDGEFFEKFSETDCKIYELEVTNSQYNEIKYVLDTMNANEDRYKYDFIGIVPRWLGIPLVFNNRFVCSQFVAHVLEEAGVFYFGKEKCFVVPKTFENLDGLKEVYCGNYVSY